MQLQFIFILSGLDNLILKVFLRQLHSFVEKKVVYLSPPYVYIS